MAISAEMTTSNQYIKYRIVVKENTTSVAENKSKGVTVEVQAWRTNTGYTSYGSGTCYCKIDGKEYSQAITSSQEIAYNSYTVLFSKTLDIEHDDDGKKVLECSAYINHDVFSSEEQSFSTELTKIARKSSFTAKGDTLGSSVIVNITRASSSFVHKVYYENFNNETIIVQDKVDTACTFIVPLTDSKYIPNNTKGTIKITVDTYSDGEIIGTDDETITLSIPDTVVPTIDNITIQEAIDKISKNFGIYVQNQSKIKCNITASGIYSSTIKTYEAKLNGTTYNTKEFTTGVLNVSGKNIIEFKVVDSRGRIATKKEVFTVYAYQKPKVNSLIVNREKNNQSTVNISINASISSVNNKNSKEFILKYKKQREDQYKTLKLDNTSYNLNVAFSLDNISEEDSYNFILEAKDFFDKTSFPTFLLLNLEKKVTYVKAEEKEIELIVYNDKFEKMGIITDSESIIWHKKYNDIGEFEIYLPASSDNIMFLKEDFYVVREDDDAVGIIENFHISYDETNETDMMSVSGRFAESILERRIIWNQTQVKGYLEQGIRSLIMDNIISPTISARKIPFIKLGNLKGFIEKIEAQYTGDNLSTVIHDICNAHDIGYKLLLGDKTFYFELYKGIDSSYNQMENPHIIFSDEYDNLISSRYESNKSKYKNTALIAGEGEGVNRTTLAINNNNTGINRREIFVDAKDLSTNDNTIGTTEYKQMLQARGNEKLSEYQYTTSFDGEIRLDERYTYKKDVDLGDIIIIENTEWNIFINQRITGIIESYDRDGYIISLEFNS